MSLKVLGKFFKSFPAYALASVAPLVAAPSHRLKGHMFSSQSGYTPRL